MTGTPQYLQFLAATRDFGVAARKHVHSNESIATSTLHDLLTDVKSNADVFRGTNMNVAVSYWVLTARRLIDNGLVQQLPAFTEMLLEAVDDGDVDRVVSEARSQRQYLSGVEYGDGDDDEFTVVSTHRSIVNNVLTDVTTITDMENTGDGE